MSFTKKWIPQGCWSVNGIKQSEARLLTWFLPFDSRRTDLWPLWIKHCGSQMLGLTGSVVSKTLGVILMFSRVVILMFSRVSFLSWESPLRVVARLPRQFEMLPLAGTWLIARLLRQFDVFTFTCKRVVSGVGCVVLQSHPIKAHVWSHYLRAVSPSFMEEEEAATTVPPLQKVSQVLSEQRTEVSVDGDAGHRIREFARFYKHRTSHLTTEIFTGL